MRTVQITPDMTLRITHGDRVVREYGEAWLAMNFWVNELDLSIPCVPNPSYLASWVDMLRTQVIERERWTTALRGYHIFPQFRCDLLSDEDAAELLDLIDTLESLLQDDAVTQAGVVA